jgi:hypothetical protein
VKGLNLSGAFPRWLKNEFHSVPYIVRNQFFTHEVLDLRRQLDQGVKFKIWQSILMSNFPD